MVKRWQEIITMPIGNMPRVPIETIAGLLAPVLTDFKQSFGTYAIDLLITNLDLVNPLTYSLNSITGAQKTLAAGGEIAFNNVIIERLLVTPDAGTGTFEILPFLLPRELVI
jgi:hypothetical protein